MYRSLLLLLTGMICVCVLGCSDRVTPVDTTGSGNTSGGGGGGGGVTPPPVPVVATIRGFVNFPGTYTVTLKHNNVVTGTPVKTTAAAEPPFEFKDITIGSGYTLEVDDGNNHLTIVRPFEIPAAGLTNIDVLTRTSGELTEDLGTSFSNITVFPTDGSATLVAYSFPDTGPLGSQIILDNGAPTLSGNPTWLSGVAPGTHQLIMIPGDMTPFNVTIAANCTVVIRAIFHRDPSDPQAN